MLPSSLIALCSAASPPQCHKISMSLFDNLWADSAQRPDVAKALDAICCEGGWDVKCTIGQTAARDLRSRIEDRSGGALPSTLLDSTSSDVGIQFSVAFEPLKRHRSPPQQQPLLVDDDSGRRRGRGIEHRVGVLEGHVHG